MYFFNLFSGGISLPYARWSEGQSESLQSYVRSDTNGNHLHTKRAVQGDDIRENIFLLYLLLKTKIIPCTPIFSQDLESNFPGCSNETRNLIPERLSGTGRDFGWKSVPEYQSLIEALVPERYVALGGYLVTTNLDKFAFKNNWRNASFRILILSLGMARIYRPLS